MTSNNNNLVMEEREESMVSPTGTHSHFRIAHFLTPTLTTAINGALVQAPPPHCPAAYKDQPLQVNFREWRRPAKHWGSWVRKMHSLHHKTWKKAGILNAIMNSIYIIPRNENLIFGFSEKWCPSTNSFVFPWGEATITLEDMMILGGYSVLGDSILTPVPKDRDIAEKLNIERLKLNRTKAKKVSQSAWMSKFMESNSEMEHEAFLIYWLSRFVFPFNPKDTIGKNVFSIGVHLARGVKIALAPPVLASIYQSLSLLKSASISARKRKNVRQITISAPLALVQVWVFERFPSLRPKPNSIQKNEPRMARWHNLKKVGREDILLAIDSAAESFEWRPYMKNDDSAHLTRKIYKDNEYWVLVDSDNLDEELEGLVRCLRTSELVGLEPDCIEQYLPHRVAMQFGMDQDIPCHVARVNKNRDIAWNNYNRSIIDEQLYVPSRPFEPGVTTRYLKWWREDSVEREPEDDDLIPLSKLFQERRSGDFVSQEVGERQSPVSSTSCGKNGFKRQSADFSPNSKRKREEDDSGDSKPFEDSKSKKLFVAEKRTGKIRQKSPLLSSSESENGSSCGKSSSSSRSRSRSFKSSEISDSTGPVAIAIAPPPGLAPLHNSPVKALDIGSESCGNGGSRSQGQIRKNIKEVTSLKFEINNKPGKEGLNSGDGDIKVGGVEAEQRLRNIEKLCLLLKEGKLNYILVKNPNKP